MTEKNQNPWNAKMWEEVTLSAPKSGRLRFITSMSEHTNPWVGADHDIVRAGKGNEKVMTVRK